jgi:membrane protease YdiL (CAAX protease family)
MRFGYARDRHDDVSSSGDAQVIATGTAGATSRTATFTTPELFQLLALTSLPVVLTTALMRGIRAAGVAETLFMGLHPSYVAFIVYAFSNWITFALVVRVAGMARLRAHGLRLRLDGKRAAAGATAFFAGLGVYGAVTWALAKAGLPGVGGMDYPAPHAGEVAILVATVVVTAAFCEEVFFRVVWIGALGERIPWSAAAIVSIAAFAVIHYPYFGLGGVVFISVWAILPATLFVAFGDVGASLLMHLMNNAFAYILVPLLLR